MKNLYGKNSIVILANGGFPESDPALSILENAEIIICCDEAADRLLSYGKEPGLIIGDMDSVSKNTLEKYADRIVLITEQETNDLTKAVNYCIEKRYPSVIILGATGLREDHTLGNISLLVEYNREIDAIMVTDYGTFSIVKSGKIMESFPGEKISFFSVDNHVKVTSEGLKYPLENLQLHNWWRASLNEVTSDKFSLHYNSKWPLILFRKHAD